jgi:hypothetical protein
MRRAVLRACLLVSAVASSNCSELMEHSCTPGETHCSAGPPSWERDCLSDSGQVYQIMYDCPFGWSCVGEKCGCPPGPCCGADHVPTSDPEGTPCGSDSVCVQGSCVPDTLETKVIVQTPGKNGYTVVEACPGGGGNRARSLRDNMECDRLGGGYYGTDPYDQISGYAPGSRVTLYVIIPENNRFVRWGGACVGVAPACEVAVRGHVVVEAHSD